MGSEHYCLRWNNHQNNLLGVFSQLLRDESLVDVTLACSEGHSIRAHKVVLSACSSYFQTLFVDHPSRHPIVILKDVRFSELRTLVDFMYKGEVNVEYCQLSALLKTAESLKVKGLAEMTRDYKPDPGHADPTEFGTRGRPAAPPSPLPDERDGAHTPPANLRVCKMLHEHDGDPAAPSRPPSPDNSRGLVSPPPSLPLPLPLPPPANEHGHSLADMVMHNSSVGGGGGAGGAGSASATAASAATSLPASMGGAQQLCPRIDSPINNDAVPGPSTLPPVQQVPLSLKKEVDWSVGSDEKPLIGESSSDYSRHPDPEYECKSAVREDSPRLYHCMYCGISFPHQSKLTRHILSHSLETLKYRELQQSSSFCMPDPTAYMESPFSGRIPSLPHEPPDPTDQPPTPMDLELGEAAAGSGAGGVVLCKFCGKSFPDVSSLIAHLPVHTGDRPFKCEFCGKAFKLRHHMKDHCRVHTGERPFRCALCGKTFSRSTILKAHEKTHYPKYVRKFLSPSPLDTEEESPH